MSRQRGRKSPPRRSARRDPQVDDLNLYTDISEASHDKLKQEGHHPDQPQPDPEKELAQIWEETT